MAIDYLGKLAELKKPDGTAILPGAAQSILDIGTALNWRFFLEQKHWSYPRI